MRMRLRGEIGGGRNPKQKNFRAGGSGVNKCRIAKERSKTRTGRRETQD